MSDSNLNANWFAFLHRADCERVLRKEFNEIENDPNSKGVFLVRRGQRTICPFVLMCYDSTIKNFPIYQYEKNSFFSLDQKKLFRGLDELVKFYCSKIDQKNVQSLPVESVDLTKFKPISSGILPPLEFCAFGSETIVHKCIVDGDIRSFMIALKDNPAVVDFKNRLGQTPLHIACMHVDDELSGIAKILITTDSNLFARDSKGDTAFIIACKNNNVKSVKLMIQRDSEIIQARNFKTDNSALHVAVISGNSKIVKILLDHGALILQMNKDGKYPIDYALKNIHIMNIIMSRVVKINTKRGEWDHRCLQRAEAEEKLRTKAQEFKETDGVFLVRFSRNRGKFILTILCNNEVKHFEITKTGYLYFLNEHQRMTSLEEIISHHMKFCDGLPTKLRFPVKPSDCINCSSIDNGMYFEPEPGQENPYDEFKSGGEQNSSNMSYDICRPKEYYEENLYDDVVELSQLKNDVKFFTENEIAWGHVLGRGRFGVVRQALLLNHDKPSQTVAVKTTIFDDIEYDEVDSDPEQSRIRTVSRVSCNFLREAAIMTNFDHANIVKLIGIINSTPLGIIQEYLSLGSLIEYLRNKSNVITSKDSNTWAYQVACGMRYLEKKKFVHRDLAARNILLGAKDQAKICDFGLSRTISVESNQFAMDRSSDPVPWRNYAPECFCQVYTHKSDVWSFGVTLWEIYSRGEIPYEDINFEELKSLIECGYRLSQPMVCPRIIYDEMIKYWDLDPRLRPTFQQIVKFYSSNDYQNL